MVKVTNQAQKLMGQTFPDALQEELEKMRIYSPGDPTAKQTYSGKAWLDTSRGGLDGMGKDSTPMAGVKVLFAVGKW